MPPKLSLRRLNAEDAQRTFEWRNDPEIYYWCRQNDVLHFDRHMEWLKCQARDPSVSMYVIEENNTACGVCGLTSIDLINRRAEFSLYIAPKAQGMGLGEAALRELVRSGFNSYGLNSIWGESFDKNPAIKMFKRVGFKEEGRRRQFYFRDGKFVDAILFSILRGEHG